MTDEVKAEKLKMLYAELVKAKSDKIKMDIRKQIKETKEILTTEDFERMMNERSEIDTSKC